MPGYTDRIGIATVHRGRVLERTDTLANQTVLTIELSDGYSFDIVCSPGDFLWLAYGYLVTEGYILWGEKPVLMEQSASRMYIELEQTHTAEPAPVESDFVTTSEVVCTRVAQFITGGKVFLKTGATHSAAISSGDSILCAAEDVSRTAALQKVIGHACLEDLELQHMILILSCRVPAAFISKAARAGIPVIAAVSAPTLQAVEKAEQLGICLCGFVRGNRMNVYSSKWRLGL
ncbi:MAG: formate dehydrogenase accessory sulfurtransferase FdhD [Candidatus Sabulitectum sp.]|nr:formate dehydrogenase accessory sulfurtransferase FdhD [Candidatus Sabulitectum sp.]